MRTLISLMELIQRLGKEPILVVDQREHHHNAYPPEGYLTQKCPDDHSFTIIWSALEMTW